MADYINGNILCQAYVKIEAPISSIDNIGELKADLADFVRKRGEFYLYKSVDVDIEVRDGSIIEIMSLEGALTLCGALAAYPTIRQGAILLYTDVKRLADSFVSEGIFAAKAERANVVHVEARTGVIGSFRVLVDALNRLENQAHNTPADVRAIRVESAAKRANLLLKSLKAEEDIALVVAECRLTLKRIPAELTEIEKSLAKDGEAEDYRRQIRFFENMLDPYPKQQEMFRNNPPELTRASEDRQGNLKLRPEDEQRQEPTFNDFEEKAPSQEETRGEDDLELA